MSQSTDPLTEYELNAYVDDQLDIAKRVRVEGYLANHPQVAARVMADLKIRDELRMASMSQPPFSGHPVRDAARRLENGFRWQRFAWGVQRSAVILLLIGTGWIAHAEFAAPLAGDASVIVEEAILSHRTALLRASMESQLEAPNYDPAEIRLATNVVMPPVRPDWRVLDVQVFPSKTGASVEMALDAGSMGVISLFAVHAPTAPIAEPKIVVREDQAVAFWQTGSMAFALTGTKDAAMLLAVADGMFRPQPGAP